MVPHNARCRRTKAAVTGVGLGGGAHPGTGRRMGQGGPGRTHSEGGGPEVGTIELVLRMKRKIVVPGGGEVPEASKALWEPRSLKEAESQALTSPLWLL